MLALLLTSNLFVHLPPHNIITFWHYILIYHPPPSWQQRVESAGIGQIIVRRWFMGEDIMMKHPN